MASDAEKAGRDIGDGWASRLREVETKLDLLVEHVAALDILAHDIGKTAREIRQLVGPFGVMYADDTVLVQTLYGTKYFVNASDLVMTPQLIVYRQWESDVSRFLVNAINRNTVFVDIGASFGYFTCLAGTYIGTGGSGRVIAVEASPPAYELLQRNIRINWSMAPIETRCCAAADIAGRAKFFVPRRASANGSMAWRNGDSDAIEFDVETRPVDAIISEGSTVDIVKIDVEGFEYLVLRGAERTISQSPGITILMEWSPHQMAGAGFSVDSLLELCQGYNLNAYRIPTNFSKGETVDWRALRIAFGDLKEIGYDNIVLRRP